MATKFLGYLLSEKDLLEFSGCKTTDDLINIFRFINRTKDLFEGYVMEIYLTNAVTKNREFFESARENNMMMEYVFHGDEKFYILGFRFSHVLFNANGLVESLIKNCPSASSILPMGDNKVGVYYKPFHNYTI